MFVGSHKAVGGCAAQNKLTDDQRHQGRRLTSASYSAACDTLEDKVGEVDSCELP